MEIIRLVDDLIYFKNVIPNHKEWLEALENTVDETVTDWVEWTDANPYSLEQAKSDPNSYGKAKCIYFELNDKKTAWIAEIIEEAINKVSEEYIKLVDIGENNPRIPSAGCAIGKYYVDMKPKGMHKDCNYDEKENSFVIYLNDDYTGGEIEFPHLNIFFKPEAGSILMFPSMPEKYTHQMAPLKSGFKYMIPYFWRMGHSQGFISKNNSRPKVLEQGK